MESIRDDTKIMIFYLLSGEEILRMNIIREETTIKDIEESIKLIRKKLNYRKVRIISENFDMNRLETFNNFIYAWDFIQGLEDSLIQRNENIIKVDILLNNNYLVPISEIDVSKFIFKQIPSNLMKYNRERVMQVMYINYEEEKNTLSFQTSPTKIVGKGFGYFHPYYIYTDYKKTLLNIPINEFDSVSLIRLNEYLKSLEFRKLIRESGNNCCLVDIIKINKNNSEANRITVNIVYEGIMKTRIYIKD